MTVQLHYFALLQDQRGLAQETLSTEAKTVEDLYAELKDRHGFSLEQSALRVSVNEQFATWDASLNEGDEVVFIPPVSGG
jgi:molybdopterin synthase sulfur carrier subunit/molybdopterin-guanine dinucleotide biosynthesis protein A